MTTAQATWPTLLLAALTAACSSPPPPPAPRDTPEPQTFTATQLTIEEQRDGRVVWSGTAQQAEGDFTDAVVRDIELVRRPDPGQPALTFRAPSGVLAFEGGTAQFDDVSIHHQEGAILTARRADYDESEQRVQVTGPIELRSEQLHVRGSSAAIDLRADVVDVAGPIEGSWTPPGTSP